MKMDCRKVLILTIAVQGFLCVSAQGNPFAALDVIAGSEKVPAGSAGLGALDAVIGNAGGAGGAVSFGALDAISSSSDKSSKVSSGALDVVASAVGQVRPGALNFISHANSQANYYKSGAWDIPSVAGNYEAGGNVSMWIGQMLPVPQWGKITSAFGYRPRFGRMHKGIDIAMSVGDTVCCPLPGVVDRISYEAGGYGHYVVVKHQNGLETRYAHLSTTLVAPGDKVDPERPIALSGNTGNSTGPHLHFETRINGTAIDPQSIFSFAGGKMIPRGAGYGTATYSSSPVGALDQVVSGGTRGRSLNEKRTYVVKAGDTLQKIAGLAGTSVIELCKLNFISETDPLVPGTMIRLRR